MVAFADLSLSFLYGLSGFTTRDASSESHVVRSAVCEQIAAQVSSSSIVYYPGSYQYFKDNYHWSTSSTQDSECTFEPATADDVGIALRILGETQTPFGIKSGGHAANAGFSSTPGVQIAMYSFSDVEYNSTTQTATVGTGLLWDDVYVALQPYNVTVVGAKVTAIGVGGVVLGGGYSYLTNQHGLGFDNVISFELVLPNGTVTDISDSTNPDLFFALRGGFNNYGIVTRVTVKTYPQSLVWGGRVSYTHDQWEGASSAMANYWATVKDPKASIYNTYNYVSGVAEVSVIVFYDAPTCPDGIFDDFMTAPHIESDIGTRSYVNLVQSLPLNLTSGLRSVFHWVAMEEVTQPALDMIANETMFWGEYLTDYSARVVSNDVDIYLPTLYDHVDSPTAYPSTRSKGYSFIELYYGWTDAKYDDIVLNAVNASAQHMIDALTALGQDVANVDVYPNNAPPDTSLERMYGDNVPRLKDIKKTVDPDNIMGLSGGWKF
ncbi:FAD dependent oxidoreductase [Suillus bovinus]|uniref:FAD dependent oxidoreductase n=1 Tax=Suillus bovinus TaxID=48563 RepID=UPI001B87CE1A|nr:FAD dependent oxidoreductase [Suillus bovinus]KAG2143519.1 FAD dependent oxidoreductase [Suillus bovinus]